MRARVAALAHVLLLVAACATPPPTAPPAADNTVSEAELWAAHRRDVEALRDWDLRGKVAYRLPDSAGSAGMHWRQQGGQSELRLAGPLGAGAVQIRTQGPLLALRRDGIERLYPADAAPWLGDERLLPIPVAALQYWLRGLPDPDVSVDALETRGGRSTRLEQRGWILRFSEYDSTQGTALPGRITIEMPASELSLRLLLRQWSIGPRDQASLTS